ncbi:hypothetical protein Tco_0742125 [Tanacetum coccineum]
MHALAFLARALEVRLRAWVCVGWLWSGGGSGVLWAWWAGGLVGLQNRGDQKYSDTGAARIISCYRNQYSVQIRICASIDGIQRDRDKIDRVGVGTSMIFISECEMTIQVHREEDKESFEYLDLTSVMDRLGVRASGEVMITGDLCGVVRECRGLDLIQCEISGGRVEESMTIKKLGDQTIRVIRRRRIDKEGNVSRFQEYHTSDEEEEEPSEHPSYNKYGFVDHLQLQIEDQRNKFAPYPLPPQKCNMNGWLIDDANDSDLESTTSNQPMSLTMEDIGGG